MAKVLKVTWQDGMWNRDGEQPTASAEVPVNATVTVVGETLVFQRGGVGSAICLVVPETRLISATPVDVADTDG